MEQMCEHLATCGFFRRFQSTQDLAFRGFIKAYCHGLQMEQCQRKQYRSLHGGPPPDEMLPTGHPMPRAFR